MLEPILGSVSAERVLIFITARQEGYAREIARFFETNLDPIQRQLEKLEFGGVPINRWVGRTRLYAFNPRYPFLREVKNLISRALDFHSESARELLLMNRKRPRRADKPL